KPPFHGESGVMNFHIMVSFVRKVLTVSSLNRIRGTVRRGRLRYVKRGALAQCGTLAVEAILDRNVRTSVGCKVQMGFSELMSSSSDLYFNVSEYECYYPFAFPESRVFSEADGGFLLSGHFCYSDSLLQLLGCSCFTLPLELW
ncbi:hypothetical protein Y032_1474g3888, partial [Ancylostoma ceylanicum]